jgi:hypothetical protein
MAQAVSRRPLTAEARIRARNSLCGICDGQSGTGTGFSPLSLVVPCKYHSSMAVHTHTSPGDEQQASYRPQFRDIVSLHRHEQQH